jgi:hypothetical protein
MQVHACIRGTCFPPVRAIENFTLRHRRTTSRLREALVLRVIAHHQRQAAAAKVRGLDAGLEAGDGGGHPVELFGRGRGDAMNGCGRVKLVVTGLHEVVEGVRLESTAGRAC